jgi:hypothetical protein
MIRAFVIVSVLKLRNIVTVSDRSEHREQAAVAAVQVFF